jgi:hypothetical protein
MDGVSLQPLLLGRETPLREDLFLSFTCLGVNDVYDPYPVRAVVSEQYKLIHYLNDTIDPPRGSEASRAPEFELFDLKNDPGETRNLARDPSCGEIMKHMKSRMEYWKTKVGDAGMATEYEAVAMFPDRLKDSVTMNPLP